jgi:hypothetical protein
VCGDDLHSGCVRGWEWGAGEIHWRCGMRTEAKGGIGGLRRRMEGVKVTAVRENRVFCATSLSTQVSKQAP